MCPSVLSAQVLSRRRGSLEGCYSQSGGWILRSVTSFGSLGDAFSLTEPPLAQLENGDKIRLGLQGPFRDCNVIPCVWFVTWSLAGVSHHELARSDYY